MAAVIPSSTKVIKGGVPNRRVESPAQIDPGREHARRSSRFARQPRHDCRCGSHAWHPVASARQQAGGVPIGMPRRRVRGRPDSARFRLEIRQSALPDPPPRVAA